MKRQKLAVECEETYFVNKKLHGTYVLTVALCETSKIPERLDPLP